MYTNDDFNQKILSAIHSWEASHERQPPSWLQMNTVHRQEFDTSVYDYRGFAIPIVYSDNVPKGEVHLGQGLPPQQL